MPVREFKGALDKPVVREFTGQLDQVYDGPPIRQSIGPSELSGPEISAAARAAVAAEADAINREIPLMQRESFHEKSIPVLGGAASLMVPGAGWGALALQSLLAGGGTALGEFARQKVTREPIQPARIARTGGEVGAGSFAGGAVVKGLGAFASKIFSSPLDDPAKAAAQFARDRNAPFPLSSAAPRSAAGRVQQASRVLLPGEIKTQVDANRVAHFLNQNVGTLTAKAQVFDDAARQGQEFLRQVFEPGEVAIKNTFRQFTEAVGDDALIPTTNTLAAASQAAERLANRGQTTGGLYQRLRTIVKKAPGTYTPAEFDELYGAVIKQAFNSRGAAGAEGRILLEAIVKDMDDFGRMPSGASFSDEIAKASAIREQYRELRKIPQLERLATEMKAQGGAKGTRDWMDSLFSTGNGKALAKLRELNPTLYHDLADAWLAKQIDNATGPTATGIGRQVDGVKLRTWFEQNEPKIREVFGSKQALALDNFTNYAKHMSGAVKRSAESKTFEPVNLLVRGGAEVAATVKNPVIMLPGEAASFVLARGLSDPSSRLFKIFTEGFSPATRSFMVKSAGLAGQTKARE